MLCVFVVANIENYEPLLVYLAKATNSVIVVLLLEIVYG